MPAGHPQPFSIRQAADINETRRFAKRQGATMRWIYLAIVIVFLLAIVIFVVQNRELVTISFLGFAVTAPLSVTAAVVYVLGAITGGSLYALLRRSVRGSRLSGAR
jgi:lipopolysaccharide assembly protein A